MSSQVGTRRTGQVRIGGRSARIVQNVLQAALDELVRGGYDGFRVDSVAANAGVNKTSIYRRWPNKFALVSAALRTRPSLNVDTPNLGSLRADLIAMLEIVIDATNAVQYRDSDTLLRTAEPQPELIALMTDIREEFFARQMLLIDRAIERGELAKNTDGRFLLESLCSLLYNRLVRQRERVPLPEIERLVDLMLTGALNGGSAKADTPGAEPN